MTSTAISSSDAPTHRRTTGGYSSVEINLKTTSGTTHRTVSGFQKRGRIDTRDNFTRNVDAAARCHA
jgi:hypothetical protein